MMVGALVLWLVLCFLVGEYAARKGRNKAGFFLLSLLLSPLVGFVAAAASESNPGNMGLRQCPDCAEWVKPEARICRFCRADLTAPVAPPVEPVARVAAAEALVEPAALTIADPPDNSRTSLYLVGAVISLILLFLLAIH